MFNAQHLLLSLAVVSTLGGTAIADDTALAPRDPAPTVATLTPVNDDPAAASVITTPAGSIDVPPTEEVRRMSRARFSGGRFLLGAVAGGALGALATYGVYEGLCGDGPCLGGALAAMGANIAVTPLAVWGIGGAMGGRGRLLPTYYGIAVASAAFAAQGSPNETPSETIHRTEVQLLVFSLLLPFASSLCYEASSHFAWSSWMRDHQGSVSITPVAGTHAPTGAVASFGLTF